VYVDQAQFRQVFRNLLSNAVDAIEERRDGAGAEEAVGVGEGEAAGTAEVEAGSMTKDEGMIRFSSRVLTIAGKQVQRIQVQDNGSGMDQESMPRIFDPYYTSKEQGTGLGLAIVQRIVQDHNGRIWMESERTQGTRFFIDIPILEST